MSNYVDLTLDDECPSPRKQDMKVKISNNNATRKTMPARSAGTPKPQTPRKRKAKPETGMKQVNTDANREVCEHKPRQRKRQRRKSDGGSSHELQQQRRKRSPQYNKQSSFGSPEALNFLGLQSIFPNFDSPVHATAKNDTNNAKLKPSTSKKGKKSNQKKSASKNTGKTKASSKQKKKSSASKARNNKSKRGRNDEKTVESDDGEDPVGINISVDVVDLIHEEVSTPPTPAKTKAAKALTNLSKDEDSSKACVREYIICDSEEEDEKPVTNQARHGTATNHGEGLQLEQAEIQAENSIPCVMKPQDHLFQSDSKNEKYNTHIISKRSGVDSFRPELLKRAELDLGLLTNRARAINQDNDWLVSSVDKKHGSLDLKSITKGEEEMHAPPISITNYASKHLDLLNKSNSIGRDVIPQHFKRNSVAGQFNQREGNMKRISEQPKEIVGTCTNESDRLKEIGNADQANPLDRPKETEKAVNQPPWSNNDVETAQNHGCQDSTLDVNILGPTFGETDHVVSTNGDLNSTASSPAQKERCDQKISAGSIPQTKSVCPAQSIAKLAEPTTSSKLADEAKLQKKTEVKEELSSCRNFVVIDCEDDSEDDCYITEVKPGFNFNASVTRSTKTKAKSSSKPSHQRPGNVKKMPSGVQRTTSQNVTYDFFLSAEAAAEIQDRLFRECADRMRKKVAEDPSFLDSAPPTSDSPSFESTEVFIHKTFPHHWRFKDPYARLGLPRNATGAIIKSQYRKLCLRYHPDKLKAGQSTEPFHAITAAYRKLTKT